MKKMLGRLTPTSSAASTASSEDEEPPFFKVTLFQNKQFSIEYMVQALQTVTGIDEFRATEIANQVMSMGFAVVGEYVQEVAETYGDGLKGKGLVVDQRDCCRGRYVR